MALSKIGSAAVEGGPTEYLQLPTGTTAQRPTSPAAGMVRMNSTTGAPEWYDTVNARWNVFANNPNEYSIEYLVVAGGGGGGRRLGGGGGAGGYLADTITATVGSQLSVTIGAGGAGANADSVAGSNGAASSLSGFSA